MKKFIYLIVLALILGLVLTGCSLLSNVGQVPSTEQSGMTYLTKGGPTVDDAESFPIFAGQHDLVGQVLVWNDGMQVCVKYHLAPEAIAKGWGIYETHLEAATKVELIPQKNGNPPPGKFRYGEDGLTGVTEAGPYCIPFKDIIGFEDVERGDLCGVPIVIAAHAVIMRSVPVEDCWETVWQIGDVEKNDCEGNLTNYADELNWGYPAAPCMMGPSLVISKPYFADPFIVGTNLDSEFPYNSNASKAYMYATDFDVQWTGELPFGGKLTLSWSPGKSAAEKKVISDGFDTATLNATGTTQSGYGWFMDTYPLVEDIILVDPVSMGMHTINFQHTKGDGTFWDWIKLERPCEEMEDETAWGGTNDFPGKNWATYIECCFGCPDIISNSVNIKVLASPPADVRVGAYENTQYIRVWKEFEGVLNEDLYYDLDKNRSAKSNGPNPSDLAIPAGTPICIYYVHFDQVGETYTKAGGINASITFGDNILGLIISGGIKGTFADRDLMFAADDLVGYSGTTYPDILDSNDHARGFDVNWVKNTDDAVFNGATVGFNVWVANAHDSFRVILPLVTVPCE